MSLDFQGYPIVDSELLNAESRRRTVKTLQHEGDPEPKVVEETSTGKDFQELSTDEQRELFNSIGVLSVLRASVDMGSQGSNVLRPLFGPLTVEFTLSRLSDDAMVWRTRCTVHTGNSNTRETALETAARCALDAEAQF